MNNPLFKTIRKFQTAGLLSAVFVVFLGVGIVRNSQVRGDGPEVLAVNGAGLEPLKETADPGPSTLLGENEQPGGLPYLWINVAISGAGNYRIYFDYHDKQNYHYFERQGQKVSLGLREAGLEQPFVSGEISNSEQPLRLMRHGLHLGVFQGGQLLLHACDDRLAGGAVGWRMLSKDPAVQVKVTPREDIHFADDFMVSDPKSTPWAGNGSQEKGEFSARSLRHPLLSANAFVFMGSGKNTHSVIGQNWWDQYRLDASMRGPAGQRIGIVFAFQDAKNYGLFRWTARKPNDPNTPGLREIVKVQDGKETVLASSKGGYAPDQWYAASLRVSYERVTISIDGHSLLEASDSGLTCGAAGVWCDVALPAVAALDPKASPREVNSLNELMKQNAVFDDFRINTLDGLEDDFRTPGTLTGGWLTGIGTWQVEKEKKSGTEPGVLKVTSAGSPTKALIGDRSWGQYAVEADIESKAPAGIVFLHRDESNYYSVMLEGNTLRLMRVADGQQTIPDAVTLAPHDGPVRLNAAVKHGHISVIARSVTALYAVHTQAAADSEVPAFVDESDTTLGSVEAFDCDGTPKGRAGLMVWPGKNGERTANFSRFHLSFLTEPNALVTTNAIFQGEKDMIDWTNPTSDWYPPKDQILVDGRPINLLWHRGQFPGDVELSVEPREISDPKFEVALSVGKDGQGKNNGYVFRYRSGDAGEGASRNTSLMISRQGEQKTEKVLAASEDVRQLSSLSIRRCGKYIVGLVNGKPLISYRDEEPLSGCRLAYWTQGVVLRTEATKISSTHFRSELFSNAPTSWRTAGAAIAEVTNRWRCDPRWSFFSLMNDRKVGKPAVLWSKALYPGDVSVELYCSNKMVEDRGNHYTYARDINVTLCSDGADLTKGYTCSFGGQGNAGSMIFRNGVEVKRSPKAIPTDMNYHHPWFSIKVEKRGNQISFRVDRFFVTDTEKSGEMVFEDTQPLNGRNIAIWTYDHAIMISRVRVSGDGGNEFEQPDWTPGPLKTFYDTPTALEPASPSVPQATPPTAPQAAPQDTPQATKKTRIVPSTAAPDTKPTTKKTFIEPSSGAPDK